MNHQHLGVYKWFREKSRCEDMSSFLKRALVVHDVESDLAYVEINYLKYVAWRGYVDFVDYLNTRTYIRVMNAVKIIDPTFTPPFINKKSAWQRKYVEDFCCQILPDVIERTMSMKNLSRLFNVLKLIELQ